MRYQMEAEPRMRSMRMSSSARWCGGFGVGCFPAVEAGFGGGFVGQLAMVMRGCLGCVWRGFAGWAFGGGSSDVGWQASTHRMPLR